jgi:hypothetical protein
MQKYCSEECAVAAKEERKKRQRDFFHAVEPVIEISQQEYLTFSKAAVLMGSLVSIFISWWRKANSQLRD